MNDLREVQIRWKKTGEIETQIFGIGKFNPTMDDQVFFWVDNVEELNSNNLSLEWKIV